jgi:DNA repair protein RadA/Sms
LSAKSKSSFRCRECGATKAKWSGQCSDCKAWNSLEEEITPTKSNRTNRFGGYAGTTEIKSLIDVDLNKTVRLSSGLSELDRVLGGGIVNGSVILIGGDPGIGKSTLLTQTLAQLPNIPSLYVSGEESDQQISMRALRLGLKVDHLRLLIETSVERIIDTALREKPQVMVIDSIQTIFTEQLQSAPGSVAQVRDSAAQLVRLAKHHHIAMFLVGHVTKEGTLAGPRVLEHMVDTVLYFEGDPSGRYRILRAVKNRFGAVNELGIFAMAETGLKPVSNPSAIFLSRHDEPVPGSVIMVTREGTRPLLVEVQALVAESHASQPKRVTVGLESNRLAMLLAVLQRHGGIVMYDQDVFINVVGGVRINETAADLPLLLAAISSFRDQPFPHDLVTFGEIGLAGEIRPIAHGEERLKEAAKHGFKRALIPAANAPRKKVSGIEVMPVKRIQDVIALEM